MSTLYPHLLKVIKELNVEEIPQERRELLKPLAQFIKLQLSENGPVSLNFICTHNSRRSHLGQIWAQTFAQLHGLDQVNCYSGGTEATAVYPAVVETLGNQGFKTLKLTAEDNPVYAIKSDDNALPSIAFSKKFEHSFNPSQGFIALMTCSQADEGCPFIAGAIKRFALTYEDPKISDGTPDQQQHYATRSLQIATEMKFVFSLITQ